MNAWNQGEGNGLSVSETSNNINNSAGGIIRKKSDGIGASDSYLVAVGSRSARFRRKYQEKITIIVLFVILVILFIIVIIVSIYYAYEKKNKVCESRECIRSAANLLMSMDQSVDPCDDFFEYACGNWAEDHPQPDFSVSYDWFTEKQKRVLRHIRDILAQNSTEDEPLPLVQAKEMYAACIDIETLDKLDMTPVIDFMKNVKLPPFPTVLNLTKPSNNTNFKFDWLSTIVRIKKKMAFDTLIGFEIYPDSKNSTLKRLVFGQPSGADLLPGYKDLNEIFKILNKNKYDKRKRPAEEEENDEKEEEEEEDLKVMEIYKTMMKEALKEVVKCYNEKLYNETGEILDKNIDKVLVDYIAYSKIVHGKIDSNDTTTSNSTQSSIEDEIVFYTVKDLQNLTDTYLVSQNLSKIDIFLPYLIMVFNGTGVKLNLSQDLIMTSEYDITNMKNTLSSIQNISPLNLELFVWLQIIENFIPHTTSTLKAMYDKYVKILTGIEIHVPRSVYCARSVTNMVGMAIGYAFAEESFTTTTLPKIQKMLSNIKNSFESLVSTLSWMDLPTKRATVEKVRSMKSLIGFPDWLFEPGKLEEYYEGMETDPKMHLENQLNLLELGFNNKIKNFRKPYESGWDTIPTEVNAYHTFQANTITIPLVMMQYPFYDLGLEALNYGALGTILGHELTHGFDNYGRQYDKDGTFVQWWTNSTIDKYENKTQCLVRQYSSFYVPEVDDYVNGNLTLGENIADNGGLRSSLRAYWMEKENVKKLPGLPAFNGDQLFFLSYGNLWCSIKSAKSLSYDIKDEHSPSHLRLKGTLQNMPEFARAWKCPLNSTMNPLPHKRCIIF
ncbi:endothelin-converting enzyme homolog [Arctopsyche grandis]|uniref:endothelin-converting enzyme homolog n=1 Tax=Arctopsyche grandis TaxID=121162 RepID=UPI00406D9B36